MNGTHRHYIGFGVGAVNIPARLQKDEVTLRIEYAIALGFAVLEKTVVVLELRKRENFGLSVLLSVCLSFDSATRPKVKTTLEQEAYASESVPNYRN